MKSISREVYFTLFVRSKRIKAGVLLENYLPLHVDWPFAVQFVIVSFQGTNCLRIILNV